MKSTRVHNWERQSGKTTAAIRLCEEEGYPFYIKNPHKRRALKADHPRIDIVNCLIGLSSVVIEWDGCLFSKIPLDLVDRIATIPDVHLFGTFEDMQKGDFKSVQEMKSLSFLNWTS